MKGHRYPITERLLSRHLIWEEDSTIYGKAYDGATVCLGYMVYDYDRERLENYLRDHPKPTDW